MLNNMAITQHSLLKKEKFDGVISLEWLKTEAPMMQDVQPSSVLSNGQKRSFSFSEPRMTQSQIPKPAAIKRTSRKVSWP